MNVIAEEAQKRQAVVKLSLWKGKSFAGRIYGESLSSVKRWCKRYDGTWRSLAEKSHRPHSHSKRHTENEEQLIKKAFKEQYLHYGRNVTFVNSQSKCNGSKSVAFSERNGSIKCEKKLKETGNGSQRTQKWHDEKA